MTEANEDCGEADGMLTDRPGLLPAIADPADWVAAIGPSAHPCCHEVSQGLIENFRMRTALPREDQRTAAAPARPASRFAYHSYRRDRETRTPMAGVQWPAIAITIP